MKPAICLICGKNSLSAGGDWVEFADYMPSSANEITHPKGFEWFCNEHLDAAKSVAELPSNEGIKILKRRFNIPLEIEQSGEEEKVYKKKKPYLNNSQM
jgi:hypothetical protein